MAKRRSKKTDPLLLTLFEKKPSKGELQKMAILQEAIKLLATKGIEGITYESLAKKMKTTRSHIAYYFKGRKEIILMAIQYIVMKGQETVTKHLTDAETSEEVMDAYIDGHIEWLGLNKSHGTIFMIFYQYTTIDKDYREMQVKIRQAGLERLQALIESLLGDEKGSVDTLSLAENLHGIIIGQLIVFMTALDRDNKSEVEKLKKSIKSGMKTLLAGARGSGLTSLK